jgi:hypothetical protein
VEEGKRENKISHDFLIEQTQDKLQLNVHKQWEQYGAKKYSIKDAFSIVHTAMNGG